MRHMSLLFALVVLGGLLISTQVLANGGYPMTEQKATQTQLLNIEQMSEVQRLLSMNGFNVRQINGFLDVGTKMAISHFQEAAGLTITGAPNEETLRALASGGDQLEYFGLSPAYGSQEYSNENCCP